jgi:hypothetical protein
MAATQILARFTSEIDTSKSFGTSHKKFLTVIVPIGLMFTGSLIFNNLPYLTLNVAFIQMIKVGENHSSIRMFDLCANFRGYHS